MSDDSKSKYPHLFVSGHCENERYTYPREVKGTTPVKIPSRNRSIHSGNLLRELADAKVELSRLTESRRTAGISEDRGIYLTFESEPSFELKFSSLDRERSGIELVAVQLKADTVFATVYVPIGKLEHFVNLVEQYKSENLDSGKPKNKDLVESISHIKHAALESFWTDDIAEFPSMGVTCCWEVWLRRGKTPEQLYSDFVDSAVQLGLQIGKNALRFLDRTVVLVVATKGQMAQSAQLLDCIAELRLGKDAASFFCELTPREQGEWVNELQERIHPSDQNSPSVCLLDTGVSREHPLLAASTSETTQLTCNTNWGVHDHHQHGTEMAGLALYGDLTPAMTSQEHLQLEHRLESVKILAPCGMAPDSGLEAPFERKELYGALTAEAASRIEMATGTVHRVFSMAVMTNEGRDRGAPSSWSAEIDNLCAGGEEAVQRLFVLSAGNVERKDWPGYPETNDIDQIHDPGQAWNAITVGACTEMFQIDQDTYPEWSPISKPGSLSPCSTTSATWNSTWPNKPDFVLEGGNGVLNQVGQVDAIDDLSLLTTYFRPNIKPLVSTGDTSAACAQASRMAAILSARYSDCWPETIRGLMIHSAEWSPEMLEEARERAATRQEEYLLRRYGYGKANLNRACWSASDALTLVSQDTLQPFEKKDGGRIGTKDMNLYTLPWPKAELEHLFSTEVELRVTLSYYVEPNPARRGWKTRHRYQSHGLRFSLINPGEPLEDFKARVTKDAQDEESEKSFAKERNWKLGRRRNRGSVHSDIWTGTAADLASRFHLAVFPVGGWWKERANMNRWENEVRYSLLVSIRTPKTNVDIYTAVKNQIEIETEIEAMGI